VIQPIEALIRSGEPDAGASATRSGDAARGETPGGLYLQRKSLFEERRYAESLQARAALDCDGAR
jgi:hypothetical protein